TRFSRDWSSDVCSSDLEKMYYLARFEKGADLWVTNLRTRETKIITKVGNSASDLHMDKEGKHLFLLADGKPVKVTIESSKKETKIGRASCRDSRCVSED